MSWPNVALGEIFDIARGGSPRPIDDYITDAPDGVNWISIKDASNSSKYITKTAKKILPSGVSRSREVKPGDFLLTNSMSFGRPYILQISGCIHDGWLVLSGADKVVNQDYFYHLLGSDPIYRKFKSLAAGAIVKNLNIDLVKTVSVPLPPIAEQRRIAAILDKADALRAKRREAIAKLDQLLQSVFLEMFGDPVTNPKGWPVGRLADLGELDRGVSRHRPRGAAELLDGEHPLIQTGDVARSGGYIRKFNTTYSDVGLAQSKKWPAGTLCITIAANIADTGILTFDACFPDSVVGFTASEASNAEFVQSLMSFLREILEKKAPQVAQKNINLAILRELPIPIPPVGAQKKWASFAASVENMRQSLRIAEDFGSRLFASVRRDAFAGTL